MCSPKLSFIVVVYNMRREAPRTLHSLSFIYQRECRIDDYEVIVVENGSTEPLEREAVLERGSNFRYFLLEDPPPSPAHAINFGVSQARGEHVGIMIDGARIVSPGMVSWALAALESCRRPVVSTLGFHLGPDFQTRSVAQGYDQRQEDELLASIDWPTDGYRLYEISALAGSSSDGLFRPISESNCLFMPQTLFSELGGYEEAFSLPGGGLVNLDFYCRACQLPRSELILVLGEASFHQVHGGIMTNQVPEKAIEQWTVYDGEYRRIRGSSFEPPQREATLFGSVHPRIVPWLRKSCDLFETAPSR